MTVGRKTSVDFVRVSCYVIRIPKAYHTRMSSLFRRRALVFAVVALSFVPFAWSCPVIGFVSNRNWQEEFNFPSLCMRAGDALQRHEDRNILAFSGDDYVLIYDGNGFEYLFSEEKANTPACVELIAKLKQYNQEGRTIRDLHITEDCSGWIIIVDNSYYAYNAPNDMLSRLNLQLENGEQLLSASFNEYGDFAILTNEDLYYLHRNACIKPDKASRTYDANLADYGRIKYVHVANTALVICTERVVIAYNVPMNVLQALQSCPWIPDCVKVISDDYPANFCLMRKDGAYLSSF